MEELKKSLELRMATYKSSQICDLDQNKRLIFESCCLKLYEISQVYTFSDHSLMTAFQYLKVLLIKKLYSERMLLMLSLVSLNIASKVTKDKLLTLEDIREITSLITTQESYSLLEIYALKELGWDLYKSSCIELIAEIFLSGALSFDFKKTIKKCVQIYLSNFKLCDFEIAVEALIQSVDTSNGLDSIVKILRIN